MREFFRTKHNEIMIVSTIGVIVTGASLGPVTLWSLVPITFFAAIGYYSIHVKSKLIQEGN